MSRLFLSLGGNQGDKSQVFNNARNTLERTLGRITDKSAIYETEPWGFQSDDFFWNQVIVIETELSPREILQHTKQIEIELGRVKTNEQYCSRSIDIDILFYDDLILQFPDFILPHSKIIDRRFVLTPLAEVAPHFIHPVFKQTIAELLENCSDTLQVLRLTSD